VIRRAFAILLTLAATSSWSACAPSSDLDNISIVFCGASPQSADNKAAIDRALAAAASYGTGIYIPNGVFLTSGKHTPPSKVGVFGRGTLKLISGSDPIIDTANAGNTIQGPTFDLSACPVGCTAVQIDGGSSQTVVDGITSLHGRIIANVKNGGKAPTQLFITKNILTGVRIGGTSGGSIEINSGTTHFSVVGNQLLPASDAPLTIGAASDGAGIAVATGSSYGEIIGNDTEWNGGNGIYLLNAEYVSIVGNQCSNNGQSGIDVGSHLMPKSSKLSLTANNCSHNRYDGIDVNESAGLNGVYITIQGNTLDSNGSPTTGGTGVYLQSVTHVVISSNTILDNGTAGIWLNSSQSIAVTGNTISNSSRNGGKACGVTLKTYSCPGILIYASSYNIFGGNLADNTEATPTQSYGILEADDNSDYNTFTGNISRNNINGGFGISGRHDTQSGNL
jgi:parallel beta-helix repeat protein